MTRRKQSASANVVHCSDTSCVALAKKFIETRKQRVAQSGFIGAERLNECLFEQLEQLGLRLPVAEMLGVRQVTQLLHAVGDDGDEFEARSL